MRALDSTLRVIATLADWLCAAVIVAVIAIVASQFVDRHFVSLPIQAPDQYVRIGVIWITFVGFALAIRDGTNIRVDLIDRFLPGWVTRSLAVLFDLLILALAVLIAVKGWVIVELGAGQLLLGTPFNAAVPNTALFVSAILIALFVAARLLRRCLGRGEYGPEHG
jgi:TRAP-type C4-dicarboxylate transport system permease small subunit